MINVAHQMRGSIRCSPLGEHDKIKGKITFTINQKLSEQLIREVERIASEYDTSFNNVVVSMIEYSLQNEGTNPGMEEQHERTQAAHQ